MSGRSLRGVRAVVAAVLSLSLVLTGCSAMGDIGDSVQDSAAELMEQGAPEVSFSVDDGTEDASVVEPFTITSSDGPLETVRLVNEEGRSIPGTLSADRTTWTVDGKLGYGRTYTATASVEGNGKVVTSSFSTVNPQGQITAQVSPGDSMVVGIGQPVRVTFSQTVPDKAAAEAAITVTTTPEVEGAFFWVNDHEVRWRPENYFEPGTAISVNASIYGHELGKGLYGGPDVAVDYSIGDAVIAVSDDTTKQIVISRNGVVEKTMATSMGSDRYPTPNGVYIVAETHSSIVMDSTTFGLSLADGGYRTPVEWATRMSYSGIFVHAAPWSVSQQGFTNVSHGCLNVTTENARWFSLNTKPGDIVVVKNTIGGTLSGYDGLGDWNIPWETWKAGNATIA